MNQGIAILEKELKVLTKLGHNATVSNYKPERVEGEIGACCGKNPFCREAGYCYHLWCKWSTRAPIEYAPMEFERVHKDIPTLDWMPILILGIRTNSWALPE